MSSLSPGACVTPPCASYVQSDTRFPENRPSHRKDTVLCNRCVAGKAPGLAGKSNSQDSQRPDLIHGEKA